jgi:two-component system sensor kinase FixL
LSTARPRYAENGGFLGYVGSIIDITDRKQTEELQSELFHVSRFTAMGEMASTLAHELNQPLTAIVSYLKGSRRLLARMEGPRVSLVRDAIDEATGQALRAGQIIRHLREFVARGESERRIEVLQKVIEDAGALALVGARERGVHVDFVFTHSVALVIVDRVQVQQVLLNLIRNAVEAMQESLRRDLVVSSRDVAEQMVQVSVRDTGPGIAPEVCDELFVPFNTTKITGMGVGLSICRTIIEAHGGRIWADSQPDAGTTFHFTLRTVADEEIAAIAQPDRTRDDPW